MKDPTSSFMPPTDLRLDEAAMAAKAIDCVDAFTERFNARDLRGMDALLHFPHVILSGEKLVIWEGAGQLATSFFEELEASTGWYRTTYHHKRVVLVSSHKVHLLVEYSRDNAQGEAISYHRNLWIVTLDQGRWGIKQRSY
jgi:hypothetical protein